MAEGRPLRVRFSLASLNRPFGSTSAERSTRESGANQRILPGRGIGSVALIRTDVTLHALRAWPRIKAMRRSAAFAPQWLVLTGGATSSARVTAHSRIARIGRREVDHSALNEIGAEECACRRGKLAELPAGIDPFQH